MSASDQHSTPPPEAAASEPGASAQPAPDWIAAFGERLENLRTNVAQAFSRLADSRVGDAVSLDLRSLALFRILLGLLVIADLAGRIPNFRAHFTESGVMPRDLVISSMSEWRWSLFLINGSDQFQFVLFAVGWAAAVLLIVGFRTRLMMVIVWIIIMSVQARNPIILSGADTLLRVVCFWAMLLPLGAVWSIDSSRAASPRPSLPMRFVSFTGAGLLLQIAFMYWFTALLKTGPTWRSEGTALFYATTAGQITRPVGEWLNQFPDLLRVGTHIGFGIESIAPFLLFIPFRQGIFRMVGIAAIVSLHIGIWLIMDVALFPWISSLVMAAFLPASFWAVAQVRVRSLVDWLRQRAPTFGLGEVAIGLPSLSPSAPGASTVAATGETTYQASSQRRQRGAADESGRHQADDELPVRGPVRRSWLMEAFAVFCIVFIFGWNMTSVTAYTMPAESRPVAYGLGIYQKWNMFSPNPPKSTVWYVVRGYVDGGDAVDLLTPIVYDDIETAYRFSWDEPDNIVSGWYKDKYWRKYFTAIADDGREEERREFARYACREWNAYYTGPARLNTLELIVVRKPTLPDGTDGEETRTRIASYTCS